MYITKLKKNIKELKQTLDKETLSFLLKKKELQETFKLIILMHSYF